MKAKAIASLLMLYMFAQSTLISYHTEAFVKTEVGCTVHGQTRALERKRPEGNLHIIQPQNQNLTKWSSSTRSILPLGNDAGISLSHVLFFLF